MQILVHLGLNKCASTYIQRALAAARINLIRRGVYYAVGGAQPAQYGVSRHYGFGPDAEGVTPTSLLSLADEAEKSRCSRLIVSSEYMSLGQPAAVAAFAADVEMSGWDTQYLFFSRDPVLWLHSLFNQYVKTVDGGPQLGSINAFIDQVLENGAIDISGRYHAWATTVGTNRLTHHHICADQPPGDVLTPFSEFAGMRIASAKQDENRSLSAGALYLTGMIRQAPPTPGRDRLLSGIARSECAWVPVPADYLVIDPERRARLDEEVVTPFAALPRTPLPISCTG